MPTLCSLPDWFAALTLPAPDASPILLAPSNSAPTAPPPRSGLAGMFILVTVLIDAMGIGLIMPVMPQLIREVQGGDLATAALWGAGLTAIFAVMQFIFSPILGNLSDRFGRRPVLLVSLAVMALDYVLMAVAGSIFVLFVGRIIGGITSANHATAVAYIADTTTGKDRAARFGLIQAAFGVGFVIGPLMGGLLGEMGTRAPFIAAAALTTLNLAFGALILPESLTAPNRRAFSWKRANPLGAFRAVANMGALRPLLWMLFVYQIVGQVYPVIWSYFAAERFGWDTGGIGLSLAVFGMSMAFVQIVLIRPALRIWGEARTVRYGILADVLGFSMLCLVTNGALVMYFVPLGALGSIGMPALKSIMSAQVPANAQGELQGVLAAIGALSMVISPVVFGASFAAFTHARAPLYFPGAPFAIAIVLALVAAALFSATSKRARP
ncbi:tetracycline resistance MFS efflux pump [Litorivita pollutaquae]|uniref:Tetracycline resistance MFS efflux pump n=1 Tax=Litorivita pollutaquae TaxID=2200892 RepID=A0A2V4NK20_9RHOB|nr:TCR/Tet family MFS transporter [Litorivita pollutaquae]PYC46507.1 tetracycline resistance MFS efflux pump [Litorivita pollutaquae]